jgi:F-type H+-transporting ATPase subunit b
MLGFSMLGFLPLAQAAEDESSGGLIDVVPGLMIWTLICFAITFFVLRKYAFGPIQRTIDERRERIRKSVEEADNAREEARSLLEEHRALIAGAKSEAAEILADARKVGDAQIERVKHEAESERERRLAETKRQIEAETKRSLDQIRSEVADLTLAATARVTGKVLDAEDQRRLIDEAIAELDFSALEREQR